MFTEHVAKDGSIGPMFHPMDPIIITLTRIKGKPIQVFTGYCDTTPYVQLYPGTVGIDASCTLKRLQYTFFDPALPFMRKFLSENGWEITASGLAANPSPGDNQNAAFENSGTLNDSSIGGLLFQMLTKIGIWNPNDVYIEALPSDMITKLVVKLYQDVSKESTAASENFNAFISQAIGSSTYAGTSNISGSDSGGNQNSNNSVSSPYGDIELASDVNTRRDSRQATQVDNVILGLAHEVAGALNKKLFIGTGVNHNYLTANNNVSDHSFGRAVDITMANNVALNGDALTQAGRAAMKAFGYSNWATRNSGTYDTEADGVHVSRDGKKMRLQIIWNQEGHYDHLHVGYRYI
jgi:hypothetical protein